MLETKLFGGYISVNFLKEYINKYLDRIPDVDQYINIFTDMNNTCSGLYYDQTTMSLFESIEQKRVDCTLLFELLDYINFTRKNIKEKLHLNTRFIFFMEVGKSSYHRDICPTYKKNREIKSTLLPDYICEGARKIVKFNFSIFEKLSLLMPDVYFIILEHLEADFIPHYFMRHNYLQENTALNILRTSDHDMYQTVSHFKNCVLYYKVKSRYENKTLILDQNSIMLHAFKNYSNINDTEYLKSSHWKYEYIQSITGDPGDDIPGVKRYGMKTAYELIECIHKEYNMDSETFKNFFKNIKYLKYFFEYGNDEEKAIVMLKSKQIDDTIIDIFLKMHKHIKMSTNQDKLKKYINVLFENCQLISNAYRLISFDQISEYFENCNETKSYYLDQRKALENLIENRNKFANYEEFKSVLNGIYMNYYNMPPNENIYGGIFYVNSINDSGIHQG